MTTPMIEKILLCWSGGKDSAFALHELQKANQFEVAALITTVTEGYDRISMHGVRRTLLEQQAASLGIPLEQVVISQQATNEEYGTKMQALLERYLLQGITKVAMRYSKGTSAAAGRGCVPNSLNYPCAHDFNVDMDSPIASQNA